MSDQATEASLIARTRRGDMAAYEELYRRHVDDAAKVARIVTDNSEDAPDLVNEAFTRILTRLNDGGGPDDELGPYLRTIVRRLAVDRHRGRARTPTADPDTLDVLPTADDPIDRADTTHLVRTAFETLPERWQQVLWHTEIEGRSPASLASMLDVAPNAVAALAYRAREGLRQAYLSVNLPREVWAECRSYTQKLPAYTRGTLSVAATEDMSVHLSTCSDCRDRRDELLLLTSDLRGLLVPALLLPAAAGAGSAAAGAGAAAGGGVLAWLSPTTWAKNPGTAVASAAGVAVVAVATALALTSGGDQPAADPSNDAPSGEVAAPLPPEDQPADEPESPADDAEPPADSPVEEPAGPPADQPAPPVDQPEPPADDPAPPDEEPAPPDEEPPAQDPDPEAPSIEVDLNTDVQVEGGGSVRLSVQVAGYPTPDLQWQRQAPPDSAEARVTAVVTAMAHMFNGPDSSAVKSADAATGWADVDGETGTEFVIPETTWRHDGESYRVVATNDSGSLTSSAATLDVRYEPIVLADPGLDGPVDAGDPVTLTASVRGNPVPAADDVTWERRGPTGSWIPLEADTSTTGTGRRTVEMTASFDADIPDHGARFRAVVNNGAGNPVATAPAEAVVHWSPTITGPPSDSTAALADTATIEAAVSGNPLDADDIQWEQRDPDTGRWRPADGDDTLTGALDHEAGATSTLTVDASSKSLNGTGYRVVATPDGGPPVVSTPAELTVTWPTEILSQPDTTERDEGATASFTAKFSGSPFESDEARWQYREPDGKWTTVDAPSSLDGDPATEEGATSTLTVDATRANDARNYRFVSGDIESDAAELRVHWKPEVTDHPPESLDVQWQSDATISATVDADRDTDLVWQRRPDGSRGWSNVPDQPSSVRTDHHWESTLPVADTFQNADYRLVATSSAGETVMTDEAQVTVAASGTLRITDEGDTYCVGTGEDADRAELVDCADATEFTRRPDSDRLVDERSHSPDSGTEAEGRCLTAHLLTRNDESPFWHPPVRMTDCDDAPWLASASWASDAFPSSEAAPATAQPELVYLKHFRSTGDGLCLDVEGGHEAIEAGTSLIVHECHGGENQLFTFAH